MFQKSILMLVVGLIAFTVSIANAQNILMHELIASPSMLLPYLQVKELIKEIKLSPGQQAKIQTFITESNNILKIPITKDRKTQEDILEGKIKKLLLPKQIERLNQFYIQYEGASVLRNPRMQKLLDFSAAQTKHLARIDSEESLKVMQINNAGYNPEEKREKKEMALNMWHAKMLDVLTPNQKKKLESLKGEKFGFDFSKIDI
jgi:hypothetical protein